MNRRTAEVSSENESLFRRQFAELDLLYRSAPVGLAALDRDLRYRWVNEALAAFHGVPPATFPGRLLIEMIPESAQEAALRCRQVFQREKPVLNLEVSLRQVTAPFESREFLASFHPFAFETGKDQGVCLVMVDITERKHAEKALRNSEERYRDVVEHSVYGLCRVGQDGIAGNANSAMLRILGCSTQEELSGLDFLKDVFRYPDLQAQLFATCRQQGAVQNAEAEWRRRDGGIVVVRLHLRLLGGALDTGKIEIIAEDVTEIRALERQLQQAQKFEAIGQLAGGIAHDFNNVIGAILGWAELGYEQNRATPQIAERFVRIREQADRAAALTRELLAFARRQVLQPRAIDLNTVVSGLVTFLDRVIGKDITLEVNTFDLDAVKADPTQVEQVLMNLCINARDAMPNGGRLFIETGMVVVDDSYARFYPGVTAGRYAVLSVSDTGVGMDAETLDHIFEPFFTTKEMGKGTGLGLATVYGIVKQHGGFLHVYSEPGQGSLFRIYFQALPGGIVESSGAAIPSVGELRGTETVLLAEDHESIREMARQSLSSLGYRMLCAADGEEALRLCEQHSPDVAVLDIVMPRMGGTATAEQLRVRFPGLPVVFTSGYSPDHDARTADLPRACYLQKPYSPTNLGRLVREVLDNKKAALTAES